MASQHQKLLMFVAVISRNLRPKVLKLWVYFRRSLLQFHRLLSITDQRVPLSQLTDQNLLRVLVMHRIMKYHQSQMLLACQISLFNLQILVFIKVTDQKLLSLLDLMGHLLLDLLVGFAIVRICCIVIVQSD